MSRPSVSTAAPDMTETAPLANGLAVKVCVQPPAPKSAAEWPSLTRMLAAKAHVAARQAKASAAANFTLRMRMPS